MGIIDLLHSLSKYLPEIKAPSSTPAAKERMIWTGVALVLFFMMYNTTAFGVSHKYEGIDFLQTITASRIGSLLTTGIGPIIMASIFLQLFVGAGIINLDMKDKKDRQKFLETQKVLALFLAVAEAAVFVLGNRVVLAAIPGLPTELLSTIVILQITLGSVIVLYLDEIVTKYGIGSGISLFIAAGVSLAVISGAVGLIFSSGGVIDIMASGGAEAVPNAILELLPLIATAAVFLTVVYAESVKVEIPIAFERVRGAVPRLPLKFFYVSNIPVIFAAALIMNLQIFSAMVLSGVDMPIIGYVGSDNMLHDGVLYFLTPIYVSGGTISHINFLLNQPTPIFGVPEWVHAITYVLFLALVSVVFGLFWVETSNMDAKSVASQLTSSGLQIPGFRRDPRMIEMILNKHIFPLTVMGSFAVGLLAGTADLIGALGTGTGILLTVGILARMYEQLEKLRTFELYPSLAGMFTK